MGIGTYYNRCLTKFQGDLPIFTSYTHFLCNLTTLLFSSLVTSKEPCRIKNTKISILFQ